MCKYLHSPFHNCRRTMYVSFIGSRLIETFSRQPLSTAPGIGPNVNPQVTLKPKLKSLPILSSGERLSELQLCSPTRSKDNPLQRCSKFSLVPVFHSSAKYHSCVLLYSLPLSPLMNPKSPIHPNTRTAHVSSFHDYICGSWCLSVQ